MKKKRQKTEKQLRRDRDQRNEGRRVKRRLKALEKLGAPNAGGRDGLVFGATTAASILGIGAAKLKKLLRPFGDAVNPHYRSGPPVGLYDPQRLLSLSKRPILAQLRNKAAVRREPARKAAVTKRERLLSEVQDLEVSVPVMSVNRLKKLAIEHYNDRALNRGRDDSADWDSDELFLRRIMRNYIRHELTVYEEQLAASFGRVGRRAAYRMLREKIEKAIDDAYPSLVIPPDAGGWGAEVSLLDDDAFRSLSCGFTRGRGRR